METQTPNSTKRKHDALSPELNTGDETDSNHRNITDITTQPNLWPRFLVMESLDVARKLSTLSPFIVEKTMMGLIGTVKSCKQLRNGSILVETTRLTQSNNLLKQCMFANIPIRVSAHKSLNTSKGVIRNFELARMEPMDLVEELAPQGVTAVRVIKQKRGEITRLTPVIIMTFAYPTPPSQIKAGYLVIKVDQFVPNPLRCYKCQRFGHHESTCTRPSICAKCSLAAHGENPCSGATKCPNCTGDHPAYANSCPKWIQEKEICRVKVEKSVSFPEARKLVAQVGAVNPGTTQSYSSVVKGVTRTIGTQTDCSCPCNCEPVENSHNSSTQTEKNSATTVFTNNISTTATIHKVGQNSSQRVDQTMPKKKANYEKGSASSPRRSRSQSGACGTSSDITDDGHGKWTNIGPAGRQASRHKINYP
jgi:hypothetical protein